MKWGLQDFNPLYLAAAPIFLVKIPIFAFVYSNVWQNLPQLKNLGVKSFSMGSVPNRQRKLCKFGSCNSWNMYVGSMSCKCMGYWPSQTHALDMDHHKHLLFFLLKSTSWLGVKLRTSKVHLLLFCHWVTGPPQVLFARIMN